MRDEKVKKYVERGIRWGKMIKKEKREKKRKIGKDSE